MGENAQKIGKKLEKFGVKLFEMFNWNKKMGDKEIKCTRGSHKNAQGRKKQTHGIDLYMEYEDPYIGGNMISRYIDNKELKRVIEDGKLKSFKIKKY